ncbi:MAG: 23S rRNA pseudouridine(955/2504/2580) synthase RluC [Candidatus Sedimenticola sp. (ex Thyasira tokunagai)]
MSEPQQKNQSVQQVRVEPGYEGQRIDNFLLNLLKGVPRSYIYRILRRGEVRVNKGRKKASYRLKEGDLVRVPPVRMAEKTAPAGVGRKQLEILEQSILYQDKRLLVLNKPSGMAVHGGSGLSFGVIEALRQLKSEDRELELVHRLDRDTSGCLLITRRRSALRALHELIRNNSIDKRYIALVAGKWHRDRVEVNEPLLKNTVKSGERIVVVDPRGKPSVTRFRVRERFGDYTLVEAQLITGRTHQIRVHAAHLGTPILGDTKYGDDAANKAMRKRGLKRLFLHAESLRFSWPEERGEMQFKAPLEPALVKLLSDLKR